MKSKVLFTKAMKPEAVLKMYTLLGKELTGRIAVKLHSGEAGNQNFLRPEFFKPIIEAVGGTVVECNTAYDGERNSSEKHWKTLHNHGWTKYFPVDLLDEEGPDLELSIPDGHVIKKIMWENICRIMTACWFYPILKVIRWEATAER